MKAGDFYQGKQGLFKHNEIIDKIDYGSKVFSHNKRCWVSVLRPNSHLYTQTLAHRTQFLYTPDISQILFRLHLRPGMTVVESGTGSGSLSNALIKAILPTGHLFTYEFNENRANGAREDFGKLGFAPEFVTVTHRDVLAGGFLLSKAE